MMPYAATVVVSVAVILFTGFFMTRITKKLKLPDVTAYIVTGILIGPFVLDLIPAQFIAGTDFLSDIALAFIAFSAGEHFKLSVLRGNGLRVVVITVLEALTASVFVFLVMYFILHMSLAFSVVLAALASATAPASTMMTIRQTGAKGEFVDTLLQVVALDDVVGLLAYSVSISLALASLSGEGINPGVMIKPLLINLGVFVIGGLFGFFLKLLMPKRRSTDNRLIISLAALFAFCGICTLLDVSPLLGCMSMGTVYINLTGDEKLFKQINYFSPPILLLFFVRSGLGFDLGLLVDTSVSVGRVPLLYIGILYFVVRIAGKYLGAFAGCAMVGSPKKVRNNLGLALIPQAGVAIGLAALGARTLGGETGSALQTIILASSVLYELAGPASAKLSLHLSGSYSDKIEELAPVAETDENGVKKTEVELLIERIAKIRAEMPQRDNAIEENEAAFIEAYDEQRQAMWPANRRRRMRGR